MFDDIIIDSGFSSSDFDDYAFHFAYEGKELIRICQDGSFYVNGKKTADDQKLYEAFVNFFKSAGYY